MAFRIAALLLSAFFPVLVAAAPEMPAGAHTQATRYLGPPNLLLTSALVAAGGGPAHFDSLRLLATLAGPHADAEVATLIRRFGKARVSAFVVAFDHAVNDALTVATKAGVALPAPPARLVDNGGNLTASLIAAGTMRNGRFDIGYMLEHLLSRNIHVAIMQMLDADPAVGPQRNADFHVILTSVMDDLRKQYGV